MLGDESSLTIEIGSQRGNLGELTLKVEVTPLKSDWLSHYTLSHWFTVAGTRPRNGEVFPFFQSFEGKF